MYHFEKRIFIVIPAFNPNNVLISTIETLDNRVSHLNIIVINDGSLPCCKNIFNHLEKKINVTVIHHVQNQGKGQALKTAFFHILEINSNQDSIIITADADGQHAVDDIIHVIKAQFMYPEALILGARTFNSNLPLRNYLGNTLTNALFSVVYNLKLQDTQTGLRAIPFNMLSELLSIKANRYDFESEMLILAIKTKRSIREVLIQTIYNEESKKHSHFNPIIDSFKIYYVLLRFISNSLFSAIVDYIVFIISYSMTHNLFFSLAISRMGSGILNFSLSRKIVFQSKENLFQQSLKYFLLLISLFLASYLLMNFFVHFFNVNIYLTKIMIETLLFSISFIIQRQHVFQTNHPS